VATELQIMLEETPLSAAILGAGSLAVLFCILSLVLGFKRGRRVRELRAHLRSGDVPEHLPRFNIWLELLTVLSTLLLPVLAVVAVEHGREQMMAAWTAEDPSMKAHLLAAGVSAQLNGVVLPCFLMLIQLPLAGGALGLCAGRGLQLRGLRRAAVLAKQNVEPREVQAWIAHPGPTVGQLLPVTIGAGVVGAALCFGFITWCTQLIRAFAAVAGVDPMHKARLLMLAMDEARPTLWRLPLILGITIAGVAVVAFLLLHVFSAARRRNEMAPSLPTAPRLSWPITLFSSGCCLILAVVFALLALPYREENLSPLPVKERGTIVGVDPGLTLPALEGPDQLERAPVIQASSQSIVLDGSEVDVGRLVEQLEIKRHNWKVINPDGAFPGELILAADHRTTMGRLTPYLRGALKAGYPKLALTFVKRTILHRPLLGRVTPVRETAARLRLLSATPEGQLYRFEGAVPAGDGPLNLVPRETLTYERFARVVVAARRKGREVVLVLEPAGDATP
jgi:hypothetical protein